MPESLSLAEELQDTQQEDEKQQEESNEHTSTQTTATAPATLPSPPASPESALKSLSAEVLLQSSPLAQYLLSLKDTTVVSRSVIAAALPLTVPTSSLNTTSTDKASEGAAPAPASADSFSPLQSWSLQPWNRSYFLTCLATLFYPYLYVHRTLVSSPFDLLRSQWEYLCKHSHLHQTDVGTEAAHTDNSSAAVNYTIPFDLLMVFRLSFLLHLFLLVVCLATAVSALIPIDTESAALLIKLLVVLCFGCFTYMNYITVSDGLLSALLWHNCIHLLIYSVSPGIKQSEKLVKASIIRIMETELVGKGYYLSTNNAPITAMDEKLHPEHRQCRPIRRQCAQSMQQMICVYQQIQAQQRLIEQGQPPHQPTTPHAGGLSSRWKLGWSLLHCACDLLNRQPSIHTLQLPSPADPCQPSLIQDSISIARLKQMQHALSTARSLCFQTLLKAYLANAGVLNLRHAALLCDQLRLLASVLSEETIKLQAQLCPAPLLSTHSQSTPASSQPKQSPITQSFLHSHHRLRSAQARLILASQRWLQLESTGVTSSDADRTLQTALQADVQYVKEAVADVSSACDSLAADFHSFEDDHTQSKEVHAEQKETSVPEPLNTEDSSSSSVMAEITALRLRNSARHSQLEGVGAVFEGDGMVADEGEENQQQKKPVKRIVTNHPTPSQSTPAVSFLSATLSMVSELKSVLRHREQVSYTVIQADGEALDMQ